MITLAQPSRERMSNNDQTRLCGVQPTSIRRRPLPTLARSYTASKMGMGPPHPSGASAAGLLPRRRVYRPKFSSSFCSARISLVSESITRAREVTVNSLAWIVIRFMIRPSMI